MIVQDKIISSSNEKLQIRGSFFFYTKQEQLVNLFFL